MLDREEVGRLAVGALYDYTQPRPAPTPPRYCGRYRVLGFPRHALTRQELVLYEGVEGEDAGRLFVAPVYDVAAKFVPVVPPPAGRVLAVKEGLGY